MRTYRLVVVEYALRSVLELPRLQFQISQKSALNNNVKLGPNPQNLY